MLAFANRFRRDGARVLNLTRRSVVLNGVPLVYGRLDGVTGALLKAHIFTGAISMYLLLCD